MEENVQLARIQQATLSTSALYDRNKNQKALKVLTVAAYILTVSAAAIMLSFYYVFIWDPATTKPPMAKAPVICDPKNAVIPEKIAVRLANSSQISAEKFYKYIYQSYQQQLAKNAAAEFVETIPVRQPTPTPNIFSGVAVNARQMMALPPYPLTRQFTSESSSGRSTTSSSVPSTDTASTTTTTTTTIAADTEQELTTETIDVNWRTSTTSERAAATSTELDYQILAEALRDHDYEVGSRPDNPPRRQRPRQRQPPRVVVDDTEEDLSEVGDDEDIGEDGDFEASGERPRGGNNETAALLLATNGDEDSGVDGAEMVDDVVSDDQAANGV